MASRKGVEVSKPYPMTDYQCEEDVRTLQRAAEVMADAGRKNKALKKFKAQQVGGQRLVDVLTGPRIKRGY